MFSMGRGRFLPASCLFSVFVHLRSVALVLCVLFPFVTFASLSESCRQLCRTDGGGDVGCLRFTEGAEQAKRPWQALFELARIATEGASTEICSRKATWQAGRLSSRGSNCVWTETFGPVGSVEIRWPERIEGVSEKISDRQFEIQFSTGARPTSVALDGQGTVKFGGDVLFVASLENASDRTKESLIWGTKDGFCFSAEQPSGQLSTSKTGGNLTDLR